MPLSFLVLVWVFGGLLAAALPMAVGVLAILGSMAVLRAITFFTDVSIFALNLTTAMGLALAIDYTLLIVSRYRDELAEGADRERGADPHDGHGGADGAVLGDDGRAVDGGAGAVPDVLPEVVRLRRRRHGGVRRGRRGRGHAGGDRAARRPAGRAGRAPAGPPAARRPEPGATPVEQLFWYRSTKFVMRARVPSAWRSSRCWCCFGAPFLGVKWGFPDDRVLPDSASAHQVGDRLRSDFADNSATAVTVVIPTPTA